MVEITITMVPFGDRTLPAYGIAAGTIINTDEKLPDGKYNYTYQFSQRGHRQVAPLDFEGEVKEYPGDDGILKLLYLALKNHFESS